MKRIEEKDLNGIRYERWKFKSAELGREETFSTFRPADVDQVKGTIYYFHAGNTDDRMLVDLEAFERLDDRTLQVLKNRSIQVVTPNFGLNFLIKKETDPDRAFYEYLFDEIMPAAEENTATVNSTRFSWGPSLGGHTAMVAFLSEPKKFAGAVTSVGALMNFDFYSTDLWEDYLKKGSVSQDFADNLKEIMHGCFTSYEEYRSIDPMRILGELDASLLNGKRILLDSGSEDGFGFQVGTTELSQLFSEKEVPHVLEIVEGGKHDPSFVLSRFASSIRFLLDEPI